MALFGLLGPPNIEKLKAKHDVQGLIKALGYRNSSDIRHDAAHALGQIGDMRATEPLMAALKDTDLRMRWAATEALELIGDARAVEPLVTALTDSDSFVRGIAARALGQIGDLRAVEPLIGAFKGTSEVRQAAAEALGLIGDARAVEPLIGALKDSDSDVRQAAEAALKKIDPNWAKSEGAKRAIPELVAALMNTNSGVRPAAVQALGQVGDTRAVEPLIGMLKDKSIEWTVLTALATVLERAAVDIASETLHSLLGHFDGDVRWVFQYNDCGFVTRSELVPYWPRVCQLARQELIRRGIEA